jgi:hypothetical protein
MDQAAQQQGSAKDHAKKLIHSTIGEHPVAAMAAIGVLVVLVLILAFCVAHYKAKCKSSYTVAPGLGVTPHNNLRIGGNNSMWWLGNADAGHGGPVDRPLTNAQVAVVYDPWRSGQLTRAGITGAGTGATGMDGQREGLNVGGAGGCGPGQESVSRPTGDGRTAMFCRSTDPNSEPGPVYDCSSNWGTEATYETEALVTAGGMPYTPRTDAALMKRIRMATDSGTALNEEELTSLVHGGEGI